MPKNNDQSHSGTNTQETAAGQENAPFGTAQAPAYTHTIAPVTPQDNQFWKGALIGVGVALLISNDTVQKSIMKGASTLFSAAQAGVEEVKEKFEDIRAEKEQETTKEKKKKS